MVFVGIVKSKGVHKMNRKKIESMLIGAFFFLMCGVIGFFGGYFMDDLLLENTPVWLELGSILLLVVIFYIVLSYTHLFTKQAI